MPAQGAVRLVTGPSIHSGAAFFCISSAIATDERFGGGIVD